MKIVINPAYNHLKEFVESIPTEFGKEGYGTIIHDKRNRLKVYSVEGYDIVVKSFGKPIFINQIAYSFFRPSKAERSYEYAFRLLEKGVGTPDPIAYIEQKTCGLLKQSYYISIYAKDTQHVRKAMLGEAYDDKLVKAIGRFIAEFHQKGVFHLDMSPGNILFKEQGGGYAFSLIDINRMQFKTHLSPEERYRSFRRLSHDGKVLTTLAKEYAHRIGLDEQEAISRIIEECKSFSKREISPVY